LIVLAVGAAPGALAAPQIVRELTGAGHRVEVILEPRARRFIGPAAFAAAARVVEEPSEPPEAVLFAPATTAALARLARGLAGDVCGLRAARFLAPDLDAPTVGHPAVMENLALLRKDGYRIIPATSSGMAAAGEVAARVLGGLGGPLSGLRMLVTAGGTREPIDSVRFIGNRSSGKMGRALAREAVRLGAEVSVVAANTEVAEPGTEWVDVETVEQMQQEVLSRVASCDALLMAAAISDFTPAAPVKEKIRRGEADLSLELRPTADILQAVRERCPDLFVVGFAATHGDPLADAREKLVKKEANLVVGNDISQEGVGFGADENEVYVVGREAVRFVPRASKTDVARAVLKFLQEERQG
jgi:phosphopantothenoylcysteine decarboxylase / phosphopantothenate---cysteine ligase